MPFVSTTESIPTAANVPHHIKTRHLAGLLFAEWGIREKQKQEEVELN